MNTTRRPTTDEMDAALDTIDRHVAHYAQEYATPHIYERESCGRVLNQMIALRETVALMRDWIGDQEATQ